MKASFVSKFSINNEKLRITSSHDLRSTASSISSTECDDTSNHKYLVITNVCKKPNIKSLICLAVVNNFRPILVNEPHISEEDCRIGKNMYTQSTKCLIEAEAEAVVDLISIDTNEDNGSSYSIKQVCEDIDVIEDIEVLRLESLTDLQTFLIQEGVSLVGIEIMEQAISIVSTDINPFPSYKRIALMPGNEGTGLSPRQKALCQQFVYIPQYGVGGTGSLNVSVATSIVLHRFNLLKDSS